MKKWFIRISFFSIALLFLLTSGVFFLLGTQSGTNFIISQAVKQLDGQLTIASATGTLLDRLEITDLVFDNPTGKAELGKFVLDWKSSDLLRLHFHILELSTDNISYTAIPGAPKPPPEPSAPISLPELNLPITITIEKLAISNVTFRSSAEAKPLIVEHAALALFWDKTGIQLQQLAVTMAEGSVKAQGQIVPTVNYPLELTTDIETLSPDYPAITLHGDYTGDLQNLSIKEVLRGDINADLQGTVQNVLNELAWDMTLHVLELQPKTFSPEVPGTLKGIIKSTGNLQQLGATAQLSMRDSRESYVNWDADLDLMVNLDSLLIQIKTFNLKHLDTPAVLDLAGTADMEQQLDVTLKWQSLQWPITGDAEYSSPSGKTQLTGTMEDFHLTLETILSGSMLPDSLIQLTTDGNSKSVQGLQLTMETLDGSLAVAGDVGWAPMVKWQVNTEATHLNPGVQYPDWPGSLNWKITSDGQIKETGVVTNVAIEQLQGTLRERPLAGTGNIHITPGNIQIDALELSSGQANLTARGILGDTSDLQWTLGITDFADILPDTSGTLSGSGTVRNKMTTPALTLELSGDSLVVPQLELQQINAKAEIDLSWEKPFTIDLSVNNLQSGENLIEKITFNSKGYLTDHTAELFAHHELAELSLALAGGYDNEQWQGTINQLLLDSKDMGAWETDTPAQLSAGAKAAKLNALCLHHKKSQLCANGAWDTNNTNTGGKVTLKDFPLNALSAWFPETLTGVDGMFSLVADATMQDRLQATVQADITPGEIQYATLKKEGTLSHEGMKLNLQLKDDGLDANVWLSVDSNIISGTLKSPDLLKKDTENSPSLDGKIHITAQNFELVETLVADIQDLDASIDSDFQILGTVAKPQINGKGKLDINKILIPVAGLELSDTRLNILANNSNITLKGTFNTPNGSMVIDGKALIDAEQNYPASATLKADNFRLVNLPQIRVFLDSDLLLKKTQDLTQLTGTITIPKAAILLRDLPKGATTASPDVVIVQEMQEEEGEKSPLQMNLKIALGNKVHFAGLGVNAFIEGQLALTAEPDEQMLGSGEFRIKEGSYRAYGQDLDIETGVISFPGGPLTQPGINLRATRTIGDVVAGIYAIGPASKPRITTFSRPPMSESHTISYLITGAAPSSGSGGAKLSIGKQINNKLSVSVGTDTKTGDSEFIARYRLSRRVSVQTTTGTSSNAADIFYTMEMGGKKKQEETE